jgi:hypothetical protein
MMLSAGAQPLSAAGARMSRTRGALQMLARTDSDELFRKLLPMGVQQRFDSCNSCNE